MKKIKTIRAKIILLVALAVMCVSVLLGVISIYFSRNMLTDTANQTLTLMMADQARKINSSIEKIEQSVNSLSDITLESIEDFEKFKKDSSYEQECTNKLKTPIISLMMNATGAINGYVRYNPEFTNPTSGLFPSKSGDDFEYLIPTDFSMYDPDDVAHVGWYYIPVKAGKPVWMDPYLNENINVYMISYVVPLFIDGESVGIVGMDIDFSEIENLVAEAAVYDTGYAYLVNGDNVIMYHKDYETGTSLEEVDSAVAAVLSEADKECIVQHIGSNAIVYTTLENGMKYVMTVPYNEVIKDVNSLSTLIMVVVFLGLVIAIVFAAVVSKQISAPIKQLTTIITKTADFNFEKNSGSDKLRKIQDEIGDMACAIHEMRKKMRVMVGNIDESCQFLSDMFEKLQVSSEHINEMAETNSSLTEELAAAMQKQTLPQKI